MDFLIFSDYTFGEIGTKMYTISVYLHILAACAWIGAMLFFVWVVVPWLRDPRTAKSVPLFLQIAGTRYRYFGWVSLGI